MNVAIHYAKLFGAVSEILIDVLEIVEKECEDEEVHRKIEEKFNKINKELDEDLEDQL